MTDSTLHDSKSPPVGKTISSSKRRRGHVLAEAPVISLDSPGWLRVANILALLSLKHSTFYVQKKKGFFPEPDGYDPRPFWRTETVRAHLDGVHAKAIKVEIHSTTTEEVP